MYLDEFKQQLPDIDPAETQEWLDSFDQLVETEGVLLLPASVYASDLAQVPSDRFRIGVARRDPAPALAAMDRFLAARPRR